MPSVLVCALPVCALWVASFATKKLPIASISVAKSDKGLFN